MTLDTSIHKNIMLQILKDIYSNTTIAPFLGFKGGTAAYIFYGLNRFSTDLDFDLLNPEQAEHVFATVTAIVKSYGQIKDARQRRFGLFFLLSYADKAQNIKVEINRRSFGSQYEIKTYLGISMLVMLREDMAAHKLVAMYERLGKTNRDIYDTWFFLKNNWSINQNIVEQRTNKTFKDFLKQCIADLQKMSNRHILNGIGELLDITQKDWVKKNLLTDTIFLLKLKNGS